MLVVDDEELNRELLEALLVPEGHSVVHARDGEEALDRIEQDEAQSHSSGPPIDLVLLDVMMPGMDGIEVCRRIRHKRLPGHLPVIIVTALGDRDSRVAGKEAGCDDFLVKPVDREELLVRTHNLLLLRRYQQRLEAYNERLERTVEQRTAELHRTLAKLEDAERTVRETREEIILRLGRAAEFRDDETGQHLQRMSQYCRLLGSKLEWGDERLNRLVVASPMHDVGKIGTPDRILLKPDRLTRREAEIMRKHAEIGYRILAGSHSELLQMGATIARTHHERFDGRGYPRGLSGDDIPLEGRITTIADVFDALTTRRVYKPIYSVDKSVELMRRGRSTHFDPVLLDLFLGAIDEVVAIKDQFRDIE